MLDETHAPGLESWVASANGHAQFPIQNLPFGVFSDDRGPRGGVAIGEAILDLSAVADLLPGEARALCESAAGPTLNPLLARPAAARRALRRALSAWLAKGAEPRPDLLRPAVQCRLHMPAAVGDYTDFYAGIHHATNVGKLFRPDQPLMPNYKYVPIGYHGRASSLRPSGGTVKRPSGQRKRPDEAGPSFGPCERLDYELELGVWIGGANELGTPVPINQAGERIAGYCLLNDWSARDLQAWEYQPLGPFLAKNFHTTISPWIVTPEALAPFRVPQAPRPEGDPAPLAYLHDEADQREGALGVELEVWLSTRQMRERGLPPHRLSRGSARDLYWTPAQFVAHHASGGCDLQPGDLFGSGTISAPTPDGLGSLLEISQGGKTPINLPSGEVRRFLEDGDEVAFTAHARREGFATIGFGECRAVIAA